MLHLIGLGLYDERDISLRGLEAARKCEEVFLELYTSKLHTTKRALEELLGKEVKIIGREELEERCEELLIAPAKSKDVALLVPGDPLVATTHVQLILAARRLGVETKVIHSSSIYSAVAETGLQIYKFGRTATIPFPHKGKPYKSPYEVLAKNQKLGLHTLFLLDVSGGKCMRVDEATRILLQLESEEKRGVFLPSTKCVGIAALGGEEQQIVVAEARRLVAHKLSGVPQSLVVPGKLHFVEEEALRLHELR